MKVYLICGIKILIGFVICVLVLQYETKRLKEKEKLLYHYYNLVKENNNKVIKLKHDIKNQLQVAYATFEQDKEKSVKLLDEINENLEEIHQINYCNNPILNTILAIKIAEAQKYHIKVEIEIDNSIHFSMKEIDICNLFTNLLDNSIEASRELENRYIKICVYKKLDYLVIKCENTYNHIIKKDKNGNLKSTKKEYRKHGYGMKIIEDTVDKYNGELNIQIKEDRFIVMIVFLEKEQKNDKNEVKYVKKLENNN